MREIGWTERSEAHIARHSVTPSEVEVVLADGADGRHFVVTARDVTEQERRTFDRRSQTS